MPLAFSQCYEADAHVACLENSVGLEKMISQRVEKGSIGFTAKLSPTSTKSTTPTAIDFNNKEVVASDKKSLLDQLEPADLVRFGFIPE